MSHGCLRTYVAYLSKEAFHAEHAYKKVQNIHPAA